MIVCYYAENIINNELIAISVSLKKLLKILKQYQPLVVTIYVLKDNDKVGILDKKCYSTDDNKWRTCLELQLLDNVKEIT